MSWQDQLKGDSLTWLLEIDPPEVRHLALRDLLERPGTDPELRRARQRPIKPDPLRPSCLQWMRRDTGWNPDPGTIRNTVPRSGP